MRKSSKDLSMAEITTEDDARNLRVVNERVSTTELPKTRGCAPFYWPSSLRLVNEAIEISCENKCILSWGDAVNKPLARFGLTRSHAWPTHGRTPLSLVDHAPPLFEEEGHEIHFYGIHTSTRRSNRDPRVKENRPKALSKYSNRSRTITGNQPVHRMAMRTHDTTNVPWGYVYSIHVYDRVVQTMSQCIHSSVRW